MAMGTPSCLPWLVFPDGWTISVPLEGGVIRETYFEWMATPHFYQMNRMIVLYVGDDTDVIEPLQDVLGSQFAGGPVPGASVVVRQV